MLRIQAMYFDSIRCYASYASYYVTINTAVSPGKMCSDRRKNHGCGQKKPESASSARFGVRTAAKCCELHGQCCADRVRSRTDNKDEVLEGKFVTWTFRLPPKRQLSILLTFTLLNFFFSLIKLPLTFAVFAKTRVTMRFRDKNTGSSTGLSQVCHLMLVTLWCGRTVTWL